VLRAPSHSDLGAECRFHSQRDGTDAASKSLEEFHMSLFSRRPAEIVPDPVALELKARLESLHDNCLTNLADGLDAMKTGDLTVDVQPVTSPI
jgi:hypothetical protein